MQIKRYEARDMTTALRMIKNELGSDAVILSARSLKKENKILGLVKSVGVEVTAAVDGYHLAAESNPALAAGAVNRYRRNETIGRPREHHFQPSVGGRIKALCDRKRVPLSANRRGSGGDDLLAEIFQHLLSQEVNRDVANDIIDALTVAHSDGRFDTTGRIIASISGILEQKRNGAGARRQPKSGCRVIAVVGPTGVGKTTTVAKLAARHTFERHKDVALISLDSDRIAGTADLKVYANVIGVPVKAAATPSAFKAAVNEFRRFDVVLVDTSGFNPQKQNQINDLKACMDGVGFVEIHLALSAMAKESDLLNTLRCLDTLDVQHLIFTKLDESCTYGNLINVLMRHPLPLSFVTHGREVPHNIKTGSMEKIVERLLAGFNNAGAVPNSGRPDEAALEAVARGKDSGFVANKNSDVFHRRNCKWTQKIKSKNMITFSSAQEAKLGHFMPCQDCHPTRSSSFQAGLPARDNVRISKYS